MRFNEFNDKTAIKPTKQSQKRVETLQQLATNNAVNIAKKRKALKNANKLNYKKSKLQNDLDKDVLRAIKKLLMGAQNKTVKVAKYYKKNL